MESVFISCTFSKNHIFLDNRIYSKIKKKAWFIFFLCPRLHFLMTKKKEVRVEISTECTLSWWLAMKDVEESGSRAPKFCHTLTGVQQYSQKTGGIWGGCFRIWWVSSLLSLLLSFFKMLKIYLQCMLPLKQPLKDNFGRSKPWKSWHHQNVAFWLICFQWSYYETGILLNIIHRAGCVLFVSCTSLISYAIFLNIYV